CPYKVSVTDKSQVKLQDDLIERQDETGRLALSGGQHTVLTFTIDRAGPGIFMAEVLSPDGKLPIHVEQGPTKAVVSFQSSVEGDHYVHLYWNETPIDCSPILAYCPGPPLPIDASQVAILGKGAESGRAKIRTEFVIDGRRAGPGVPRVVLQGVQSTLPVEMKPLQYDRYRCAYTAPSPGGFLLYVYWSEALVPKCPLKVTVTPKGDPRKVKVTGSGLAGGVAGFEWKVLVDTLEAGPGNPFEMFAGAPPDPTKVQVFGPGVEDGIVGEFESRFLVDTHGAGAGQLAVKIRGPRGRRTFIVSRLVVSEQ
ncbi:filamin-A, partial [Elysia marginata]